MHYISLPIYPLHYPKFCPIQKHNKNAEKLLVFGENDSRRWSNFLQMHIFWNFDHNFRICNQINYRNIWFLKVIRILIMTVQVPFFNDFSEKDPHLNAVGLCIIFQDKCFSCYILLTDQSSLPGSLCFLRYWTICVLQLFVSHALTS